MDCAHSQPHQYDDGSSFPVIASLAEVPQVTRADVSRMSIMLHESTGVLYVVTRKARVCHVLSFRTESTIPQRTSLEFHRDVEAAELAQDARLLVVLTRDGRLWRCCPQTLKTGKYPHTEIIEECTPGPRLLGTEILSICHDGFNNDEAGPALVAAGSTLGPPQVLWLGSREFRSILGLEHVRATITAVLFLSRERVLPTMWSTLLKLSKGGNAVHGAVLLGFADGAVRICLVSDGMSVHPPQLIARMDSTKEQPVLAILAIPSLHTPLIDTLCFVGTIGAVATLNAAGSFRRVAGGLLDKGPWTSAALLALGGRSESMASTRIRSGRRGILATQSDGSTFALFLPCDRTVDGLCERLPVRSDMSSVVSCPTESAQRLWLAFGTHNGSLLLMQMDISNCDQLFSATGQAYLPAGILNVNQGRLRESKRARLLLNSLRNLEQKSGSESQSDDNLNRQHEENIQLAMETTSVVLGLTHSETNRVVVSEESDTISVTSTSTASLALKKAERHWTSSLHACFGSDFPAESVVCSRPCDDSNGSVNVHYGGIAVTESRIMKPGDEYRIEVTKSGLKSTDAFVSLAEINDTRSSRNSQNLAQHAQICNSLVDKEGSYVAQGDADQLVIPL